MPRLTFTNLSGSDIAVGNADGYGKSFSIPVAGAVVDFTGVQLESCGPQLDALKTALKVTWVKAENPLVSDDLEILSGSPSSFTLTAAEVIAAKSANSVHAAFIGSVGRARLLLDTGTGDTTVTAVTGGVGGNSLTITMTGDATATVRITRVANDFTILYNSGVSTMTNVTTAINALTGADKLIEVVTANLGTGATVLTAVADDFVKTPLASGTATGNTFPGAFVSPARARNLRVTLSAGWDAGDVTVYGTNQHNMAISETFTTGSGVIRVGAKIFMTVTSATKALYGTHLTANAVIGTGDVIGVAANVVGATAILYVDGTAQIPTMDTTNDSYTMSGGTIPDASRSFILLCSVNP